jgi:hypothetical protein
MMNWLKVIFLVGSAVVAIPVGILYAVVESFVFVSSFRSLWGVVYNFFRDLSKIVSITASKLLRATLISQGGVPFGTHSVSAVLGANQRERTLSSLGVWLSELLDSIDKNHCKKASERAGI